MFRLLLALSLLPAPSFAQTRAGAATNPTNLAAGVGLPIPTSPAIAMPPPLLNSALSAATAPLLPTPSALASMSAAVPSALSAVKFSAANAPEAAPAGLTPAAIPAEKAAAKAGAAFDGALKILIAGSEAVPFIKTGGLADVMDAVSRGLASRGHDVTMVLPKYADLKTAGVELTRAGQVSVPIDGRIETANLLVGRRHGVRIVLLEHPEYYERKNGPYAAKHEALGLSAYDAAGLDDADERFGFYARAALEAMRALDIKPDIVHSHDWHAALIPAFLKSVYKNDPFFAATKTALTIHNIAFQGAFALTTATKLGFDEAHLAHRGGSNYLKSGIDHATAVTAVSPNYAMEIINNILFSMGLEEALRARADGVQGIINGIDPSLYDPLTDPELVQNYGIDNVAEGKAVNKAALQTRFGLNVKPNAPLFAVASRLTHQKGIDLIFESARDIVKMGGQLVIMGNGDAETEALRAALVKEFPGSIAAHPFDEKAVRLLYAAADFLLMPSRFEPCGLSQLIAQRYGVIPIVTSIGGLADTVVDLREDPINGTGLIVPAVASISLSRAIADAVKGYHHPKAFALARRAAMKKDSSWEPSISAYERLFYSLLKTGKP